MKLKTIDATTRTFDANGVKYHILESLPVGRYAAVREASVRLIYGVDGVPDFIEKHAELWKLLNQRKDADAAVLLSNIMNGANDISMFKTPPALTIACAYIIAEGEDLSSFTNAEIETKIENWTKGEFDVDGFFLFALPRTIGLSNFLERSFQGTSTKKPTQE